MSKPPAKFVSAVQGGRAGPTFGADSMYIFLDEITFQYRGAPVPVLDRLSLFVRSGEIVAVVGTVGAGKTTLLRYVGRRSDGTGGVFLGSEADESGATPGLVRGWRFTWGRRRVPAQLALGVLASSRK